MVPEMDGFKVCRQLKASEDTAHIPVVFVTAQSDAINEEQGISLGAIDYITKPVLPADAELRVRNHLQLADQIRACREMVHIKTPELVVKFLDMKSQILELKTYWNTKESQITSSS